LSTRGRRVRRKIRLKRTKRGWEGGGREGDIVEDVLRYCDVCKRQKSENRGKLDESRREERGEGKIIERVPRNVATAL
jgi:hypothetical protein